MGTTYQTLSRIDKSALPDCYWALSRQDPAPSEPLPEACSLMPLSCDKNTSYDETDLPDQVMFNNFLEKWHQERGASSSITEMAMCPSYQKIIGMGDRAIPLILHQLVIEGEEPDMWFWALCAITSADPVTDDMRGISAGWRRHGSTGGVQSTMLSGSWPVRDLPRLSSEPHDITSPRTRKYNCIAWAAGCKNRWWWPDPQGTGYWPFGVQREISLEAFVAVFEKQGYELCSDGNLERGFEKVALFVNRLRDGSLAPTHAAIQLDNGHWSSKLGECEDIEHYALESVNGPRYGTPVRYLRRKRRGEKQLNKMLKSRV